MAKLTQEKIDEIVRLYEEIGTYSGVAKAVGCSPATVKKYVTAESEQEKEEIPMEFEDNILPVEKIKNFSLSLGLMKLTKEEEEEIDNARDR